MDGFTASPKTHRVDSPDIVQHRQRGVDALLHACNREASMKGGGLISQHACGTTNNCGHREDYGKPERVTDQNV